MIGSENENEKKRAGGNPKEKKQQETKRAQGNDAGHSSNKEVRLGAYYSRFMLICWESSISSISVGM